MRRIIYSACILAALVFGYSAGAAQEVKDPVKEAARKLEKSIKEQNLKELREASAELVTLSKELNDEVEKSGEHVVSARIFTQVEKIEKVARRVRDKARGPY
jgi:cell division protein FtsB